MITIRGKTKIAKFFTVMSVYDFIKQHPEATVKIFYFALEESKEKFWLSVISTLLQENYGITISPSELMSLGDYTLTDEVLECINTVKKEVDEMEKHIEVIDNVFNGFGIYQIVKQHFDNNPEIGKFEEIVRKGSTTKGKFIYANPDYYVFVVTDQVNLLIPEPKSDYNPSRTLHEAMGVFSQEYCLKQMQKRLGCVVINIQQQVASGENQEFYKGQTIEKKLEPSLSELADNKLTQRDADLVLGIFAPTRYELSSYRGYNIQKLKDKYRALIFLKDRHYGLANNYVHMYFNGAINKFKELPKSEEMTPAIYQQIIDNKY